jgi:hypothetical protein
LRDWYTSRARRVSIGSSGLGMGGIRSSSFGVAVDAMCSGVWGRGHGSENTREVDEMDRRA